MESLQDPIPVIAPSSARSLITGMPYQQILPLIAVPSNGARCRYFVSLAFYISLAGLTEAGSDARGGKNFGARF